MEFTNEEKHSMMLALLETPEDELSDHEKTMVECYVMGYNDAMGEASDRVKKFKFMIDNGLGPEDMIDDTVSVGGFPPD